MLDGLKSTALLLSESKSLQVPLNLLMAKAGCWLRQRKASQLYRLAYEFKEAQMYLVLLVNVKTLL